MRTRWIHLVYDLDEYQRLSRLFPQWEELGDDLGYVWAALGPELRSAIDARFEAEGPGWKPLAPATIEARRERIERGEISVGPAHPILQQTGALRASLTQRDAEGHIERVEPLSYEFGTAIPYAVTHQYGTSRVPQRQILSGEQLFPVISRVFEDAIPTAVRRAVRDVLGG